MGRPESETWGSVGAAAEAILSPPGHMPVPVEDRRWCPSSQCEAPALSEQPMGRGEPSHKPVCSPEQERK